MRIQTMKEWEGGGELAGLAWAYWPTVAERRSCGGECKNRKVQIVGHEGLKCV